MAHLLSDWASHSHLQQNRRSGLAATIVGLSQIFLSVSPFPRVKQIDQHPLLLSCPVAGLWAGHPSQPAPSENQDSWVTCWHTESLRNTDNKDNWEERIFHLEPQEQVTEWRQGHSKR